MPEQTPEQNPAPNPLTALVNAQVQALLDGLLGAGGTPRPELALQAGGGWTVLVSVFPTRQEPAAAPDLTECERDCLKLLTLTGRPLPADRVCVELEDRGIGVHSEITVKRALANLHRRLHLIANRRKRPRGYYLPESNSTLLLYRAGA
jgi:hypothetical protein